MQPIQNQPPVIPSQLFKMRKTHNNLRLINWLLPLTLFAIAIGLEFMEEAFLEQFAWFVETHFIIEAVFFGVMGPAAVFAILIYIRRLLGEEFQLRSDLEQLNRDLESKVIERTALLAERNAQLDSANQQLQRVDQMKSDFVSLVSHELRAPLTSLNGGLEVALQSAETLPPSARRTLQAMMNESTRLTHFVQTILDVSRLEAGRLTLNLGPVAVVPILHRSVEVLFGARRRVQWELPTEVPPVWADEIYYEQIIRNLLRNADKYSPADTPIEINVQFHAGNITVEVADHGVGIPVEVQEKIFERFERGQSGESAPPGWGLGLYFAKKLTEALGGRLTLRSPCWAERETPGSAFAVTLPVAADAPEEADLYFRSEHV